MRIPLLRTASLVVAASALGIGAVACGGDDDDGSSVSGGGTDEGYVEAICGAVLAFQEDFTEILDGATGEETEEEAVDLFVEPLENYVENLKDAVPPDDLVEYHAEVIETTEGAVNRIKDEGNLDALNEIGEPEEPPADVQARLDAAAAENETCQDADFQFGNQG